MSHLIHRHALEKLLKGKVLEKRGAVIGIKGPGGFGKTTLARILEADPEIAEAFSGGSFWVTLGMDETEASILTKINALSTSLDSIAPPLPDIHIASRRLSKMLGERDALLIIDDAWSAHHVAPFLPSDFVGTALITARDTDAFPQQTLSVSVGPMQKAESLQLLGYGLPQAARDELSPLINLVSGWPVLLAILNSRLREDVSDGVSIRDGVSYIQDLYERAGIKGFDLDSAPYRNQELTSILYDSIDRLPEKIKDFYLKIAIFPEDTSIPLNILDRYWETTSHETREVVRRLYRSSLVLDFDRKNVSSETIKLHDVIRDALRAQVVGDLPEYNRRFLRCACTLSTTRNWIDIPDKEIYVWKHIGYHLSEAEQWEVYCEIFQNSQFLAKHSIVAGRSSTRFDLERIVGFSPALRRTAEFFRDFGHLLDSLATVSDRQATISSYTGLSGWPQADPHLRLDWQRRDYGPPALEGHRGSVLCCHVDDAKGRVVTGGSDNFVKIWDLTSGKLISSLAGHTGWVRSVAIDPSADLCVSASDDGTLIIWDLAENTIIGRLVGHAGPVRACSISVSGDVIVSASSDGTLKIWGTEAQEIIRTLESHRGSVNCCAFFENDTAVVSGGSDELLRIWDVGTGSCLHELSGHSGGVRAIDIASDGDTCVTASDDHALRVWSLAERRCLRELRGHERPVRDCAISRDGTHIMSAGGDDSSIILWQARDGSILRRFFGHDSWVMGCAFAERLGLMVSTSVDGTCRTWDLLSGVRRTTLEGSPTFLWSCCAGESIGILGGVDGVATIIDLSTSDSISRNEEHSGCIRAVSWLKEDLTFATCSDDQTVTIANVDGAPSRKLKHAAGVRAFAATRDARTLVTSTFDRNLYWWDIPAGLASPSGSLAISDGIVQDCLFMNEEATEMLLTVASSGKVATWTRDLVLKREIVVGTSPLTCCAFEPQSKSLAIGAEDGTVTFLDTAGRSRQCKGHREWVTDISFSPDGIFLASASDDLTVRVWDMEGAAVAALSLKEPVFGCDWTSDSRSLLVVGAGGAAKLMLVVR